MLKGYSRGALEAVCRSDGLPAVTFSILTAADRAGLCILGQAARREIEPATVAAHIPRVMISMGPDPIGPAEQTSRVPFAVALIVKDAFHRVLSARVHELVRARVVVFVRVPEHFLRACVCPSVRACVCPSVRACVRMAERTLGAVESR